MAPPRHCPSCRSQLIVGRSDDRFPAVYLGTAASALHATPPLESEFSSAA